MNEQMSAPTPATTLDSAALFRQHAGFVARFLTRLGVSPGDLDDVVQEVFLVVHARGGYVAGPAKPTSYLGAIAARAASSYRRRRTTRDARDAGAILDDVRHDGSDPAERALENERAEGLRRALASLDPVWCATLLLVDHEGETCASVAASMSVPIGTVYWRLHKARKELRRLLAEASYEVASTPPPSLRGEVRR